MTDTPFTTAQITFLEGLSVKFRWEFKNDLQEMMHNGLAPLARRAELEEDLAEVKAMIEPLATRQEVIDHIDTICEQLDTRQVEEEKLEVRVVRCEGALGLAS